MFISELIQNIPDAGRKTENAAALRPCIQCFRTGGDNYLSSGDKINTNTRNLFQNIIQQAETYAS
jgi:hypothetical protein